MDGKEFEAKNGSTYAPDQTLPMSGDLDQGERPCVCHHRCSGSVSAIPRRTWQR